uniref:Uncharacterized protein n=1 Tax=Mycena chlorophos TaxID=658473 RepID=A0ABQ0LMK4_MYCCL|nr:predicted protein [Mycena chlorophos]
MGALAPFLPFISPRRPSSSGVAMEAKRRHLADFEGSAVASWTGSFATFLGVAARGRRPRDDLVFPQRARGFDAVEFHGDEQGVLSFGAAYI